MNKSKNIKFKNKKFGIFVIMAVLVLFSIFIVLTESYPGPEDVYFVNYKFDYETDKEISTIYHYIGEEDKVYEIGSFEQHLWRGAVNNEQTHIIGIGTGTVILYDIQKKEIVKTVTGDELKERANMMNARILKEDFDFASDGNSIYITMIDDKIGKVFLYNIITDELKLIMEDKYLASFEYVDENNIYYKNGTDIYRYDIETSSDEKIISLNDNIDKISVSKDGEKILIYDMVNDGNFTLMRNRLYVYEVQNNTLILKEKAYRISDMCWNEESYLYVQEYYGFITNVNPTIKMNTSVFGLDKTIYRIEGFMKGGTLHLLEML